MSEAPWSVVFAKSLDQLDGFSEPSELNERDPRTDSSCKGSADKRHQLDFGHYTESALKANAP